MLKLQEQLGLDDISAVARFALRFFARIVREAVGGADFFIVGADKSATQIKFGSFAFDADAKSSASEGDSESLLPLPASGGASIGPSRPLAAAPQETAAVATLWTADVK